METLVLGIKWKLVSVHLEIALTVTQDRCKVCVERTIGSGIILDTPDGTPRRHGSEIVLDAPDATPR